MGTQSITATSGEIATGTSLKTILQLLAPSTCDLLIEEIYFSGKAAPSSTSHTAILWNIMVQSSAGTGGQAVTEIAWPGSTSATDLGTALRGPTSTTWTAEPTAGNILISRETPTTAPGYTWRGSLLVPAGTRIGITATSANDVTAMAEFIYRRQ